MTNAHTSMHFGCGLWAAGFADVEPRLGFDAASCSVMNNLSELVVRHLEKDVALKLKQKDNEQLQASMPAGLSLWPGLGFIASSSSACHVWRRGGAAMPEESPECGQHRQASSLVRCCVLRHVPLPAANLRPPATHARLL